MLHNCYTFKSLNLFSLTKVFIRFWRSESHHAISFSVYAVSVYLEKGGSTEKLLELECGGDLHRSEDTFKGRVKKLEEK